jgi:hypothetical protein
MEIVGPELVLHHSYSNEYEFHEVGTSLCPMPPNGSDLSVEILSKAQKLWIGMAVLKGHHTIRELADKWYISSIARYWICVHIGYTIGTYKRITYTVHIYTYTKSLQYRGLKDIIYSSTFRVWYDDMITTAYAVERHY